MLWNADSWEKEEKKKKKWKKEKKNKQLVLDPTLEKEEGFNSKHPRGWMGKPEYPGGNPISRMQRKPYGIDLDEGFTAIKV